MQDTITLTVNNKGLPQEFEARFEIVGFIHRFVIAVNEADLIFELDEVGNYRVMESKPGLQSLKGIDPELLQAIIDSLNRSFQ